jgi:hypothetical protein
MTTTVDHLVSEALFVREQRAYIKGLQEALAIVTRSEPGRAYLLSELASEIRERIRTADPWQSR